MYIYIYVYDPNDPFLDRKRHCFEVKARNRGRTAFTPKTPKGLWQWRGVQTCRGPTITCPLQSPAGFESMMFVPAFPFGWDMLASSLEGKFLKGAIVFF